MCEDTGVRPTRRAAMLCIFWGGGGVCVSDIRVEPAAELCSKLSLKQPTQ